MAAIKQVRDLSPLRLSRGDGLFHKPAAQPAGESRVDVLEEQVLLPPLDQNGEAVSCRAVAHHPCRAEVPHRLDGKSAPVRPCNGQGHHGASGVKLGCHFDVDALGMRLSGSAAFHVSHLPDSRFGKSGVFLILW